MKSYTDIEQSHKLAEILSLKSADRHYCLEQRDVATGYEIGITPFTKAKEFIGKCNIIDVQPAWSLAALLSVLESEIDGEEGETYQLNIEKDGTWWNVWYREQYDEANPIETESTEELIDACVEMIIKLNKLNLL